MKHRRCCVKLLLLLEYTVFVTAVTKSLPGAEQPKFEVASVKRSERCSLSNHIDADRVTLTGDPLKVVLMEAFLVKMDQIIGPPWLESDCFDVTAKIPQGATKDQLPAMYQALLVERFKLAAHKETRSRSGYALVVDQNGLRVKQSEPNLNVVHSNGGQVRFSAARNSAGIKGAMTMAMLARFLSTPLGAPVQDLTSLVGTYDIDLSWLPETGLEKLGRFAEAGVSPANPPVGEPNVSAGVSNLFTSLRESLGLRLESRKMQIDVIVIDHIERVPVAN